MQARHQILRQERTIARHADEPVAVRRMRGSPIETGKNAGQRSGKIRHAVGDDGQAGIGKARRVAIGIDDDAIALRREAGEHALQNGGAADAEFAPCRRRPCAAPGRRQAPDRE